MVAGAGDRRYTAERKPAQWCSTAEKRLRGAGASNLLPTSWTAAATFEPAKDPYSSEQLSFVIPAAAQAEHQQARRPKAIKREDAADRLDGATKSAIGGRAGDMAQTSLPSQFWSFVGCVPTHAGNSTRRTRRS